MDNIIEKNKEIGKQIYTLHKYFIWSEKIREVLFSHLSADTVILKGNAKIIEVIKSNRMDCFYSYWISSLYVVIEGYKELNLSDKKIDKLLDEKKVDLLRRFRNTNFHYQKEYFDKRHTALLMEGEKIAKWLIKLRDELSRYFLDWYQANGVSIKKC